MSSLAAEDQIISIVDEIGLEGVAGILRDIIYVRLNNIKPSTDGFSKMTNENLKLFADYKVMLEDCHNIIRLAAKYGV